MLLRIVARHHGMCGFAAKSVRRIPTQPTRLLRRPATIDGNTSACAVRGGGGGTHTAGDSNVTGIHHGKACVQSLCPYYTPVIWLAAFEQRKAASSPMSSGVANVLEGCLDASSSADAASLDSCKGHSRRHEKHEATLAP